MTEQSFSLIPFPAQNSPDITITGKIILQDQVITVHYALTGKIEDIFLPSTSANPGRKDELWKATCFEFFLAMKDQPQYWEFNMSPCGDWNVYHMDAYRRVGFREETSIQRLQFAVQKARVEPSQNEAGVFTLDAAVDLTSIGLASQLLEIGIATIVQKKDGNETYWALTHPAPYADFHLRESFILALAGQSHLWGQSGPGD